VTAARRHLTSRYADGVHQLLWELEKRLMPDAEAVQAVLSLASGQNLADALDVGAAMVVIQAMRLELDVLEADVLDAAQVSGVSPESVAAVLELPGADAAEQRHQLLRARRRLARATTRQPAPDASGDGAREAADRAGRRARQAADRASEAKRRRNQLTRRPGGPGLAPVPDIDRDRAERAAANAGEARVSARDAAERVAIGLLRAADALERCAARCAEWGSQASPHDRDQLRRRAAEYLAAAVAYREMAARHRHADGRVP
jgi:hypothetical protein